MDLAAIEAVARALLAPPIYDYMAGAAGEEATAAANREAWRDIRLRPRVLRDVSEVSTATSVLGRPVAHPIAVAPLGYQRLAHDEGEAATARAAASKGALMVAPTMGTVTLEEIAAVAPEARRWFQLYVHDDRAVTADLIERAAGAGYEAIVLTVDTPVLGRRRPGELGDLPDGLEAANFRGAPPGIRFDPALTFADIAWVGERSRLPVVVKGVLRSDDAATCVAAGAAGVVVSNHGGRQLDTAVASADALVDVVAAVAGTAEVYVDGGIRNGTDVLKALAMGATAVLVGRPVLWALAGGGEAGVAALLHWLRDDLAHTMALCGVSSIAEVGFDLLA